MSESIPTVASEILSRPMRNYGRSQRLLIEVARLTSSIGGPTEPTADWQWTHTLDNAEDADRVVAELRAQPDVVAVAVWHWFPSFPQPVIHGNYAIRNCGGEEVCVWAYGRAYETAVGMSCTALVEISPQWVSLAGSETEALAFLRAEGRRLGMIETKRSAEDHAWRKRVRDGDADILRRYPSDQDAADIIGCRVNEVPGLRIKLA